MLALLVAAAASLGYLAGAYHSVVDLHARSPPPNLPFHPWQRICAMQACPGQPPVLWQQQRSQVVARSAVGDAHVCLACMRDRVSDTACPDLIKMLI